MTEGDQGSKPGALQAVTWRIGPVSFAPQNEVPPCRQSHQAVAHLSPASSHARGPGDPVFSFSRGQQVASRPKSLKP